MIVYRAYRIKFNRRENFYGVFSTEDAAKAALQNATDYEPPKQTLTWKRGRVRAGPTSYYEILGLSAEENGWRYEIVPAELDVSKLEWQDLDA